MPSRQVGYPVTDMWGRGPRTPRIVRWLACLAAVAVAALALSACGDDEEEMAGPETQPAPTVTETAPETQPTETEAAGISGEQVFLDTGCGSCHTLAAAGTSGTTGPNLDESAAGDSAAQIRQSIVNPDAEITEGFSAGVMPQDFQEQLSAQELDALASYIAENAGG